MQAHNFKELLRRRILVKDRLHQAGFIDIHDLKATLITLKAEFSEEEEEKKKKFSDLPCVPAAGWAADGTAFKARLITDLEALLGDATRCYSLWPRPAATYHFAKDEVKKSHRELSDRLTSQGVKDEASLKARIAVVQRQLDSMDPNLDPMHWGHHLRYELNRLEVLMSEVEASTVRDTRPAINFSKDTVLSSLLIALRRLLEATGVRQSEIESELWEARYRHDDLRKRQLASAGEVMSSDYQSPHVCQ
eukprot:m.38879 g.38879  ORF g.38879 m.38879 type:complete len:249 (-) comp13531_c0_seq1:1299-2045(-)